MIKGGGSFPKRVWAYMALLTLMLTLNALPQQMPAIPPDSPAYEPQLTHHPPLAAVSGFDQQPRITSPATNGTSRVPIASIDKDSVVALENNTYYDFRDHSYTSVGLDGTALPFDVYYGVSGEVQGGELLVAWHNYTTNGATPTSASIHSLYYGEMMEIGSLQVAQGERQAVSIRELPTGPYTLWVDWTNGDTIPISFYKNGDDLYICQRTELSENFIRRWYDRRDAMAQLMDVYGVTPENSLDYSDDFWAYPVPADLNWQYRCDNRRWIGLARELVGDEILPDAQKAVLVHDWMTDNLAYDNYKAYGLEMTRAKYHNDYSGKYSMWDTHVGVCADFATVYAIMLRSVGVPCVCIDEDDEHAWNVAYIDGQWVEIDLTYDIKRYVMTEDVQDVITFPDVDTYGAFGLPFDVDALDPGRNRINSGVYTRELVTGRSNMNRS